MFPLDCGVGTSSVNSGHDSSKLREEEDLGRCGVVACVCARSSFLVSKLSAVADGDICGAASLSSNTDGILESDLIFGSLNELLPQLPLSDGDSVVADPAAAEDLVDA